MTGRAGGQTTTTDSRSKRIRVSRRGGQVLTRARGPSNDYGLPDLRLLPDGPVPDGRTVLTGPDTTSVEAIRGHRAHLAPFIPVTNLLERSLGEVRRRTKVMGRFPGETSCLSLVWAVLDLFFSHASNGAKFTDVDRQHLYRIKYRQADPDTIDEEVTAA
jgi:Transposase, Mutator family